MGSRVQSRHMFTLASPSTSSAPSRNLSPHPGGGPNNDSNSQISPKQRPLSSTSDEDDYDSEEDDSTNPLPFPTALPRRDFLAPDFDAATYLSSPSLAHRHQTLEDLRSDLRERSASISQELLSLVNANYTAFLGLGDELQGGEDRVEDVRVALLGFRRAVEEVKSRVRERAVETGSLSRELRGVRGEIELGRKMLELDDGVAELEGKLAVESSSSAASAAAAVKGNTTTMTTTKQGGMTATNNNNDEAREEEEDDYESSDDDDEDDDEEENGGGGGEGGGDKVEGTSASKLARLAGDYVALEDLAEVIGTETPFVRKMDERMIRCRNTLLLDLGTALKGARKAGGAGGSHTQGQAKVLRLMGIYASLDAQAEAIKALKDK